MKKFKNLFDFLFKTTLSILFVILYVFSVIELYDNQVWYAPTMALVMFVAVGLMITFLIINMPKPRFRLHLTTSFGLAVGLDNAEPSLHILFLFIHIEIAVK